MKKYLFLVIASCLSYGNSDVTYIPLITGDIVSVVPVLNNVNNTNELDDIKTNTSQPLSDTERIFVNNLVGADTPFDVYRSSTDDDNYISMDFGWCLSGSDKKLYNNCDYKVTIEDRRYNIGFKNHYVYIFFYDGVKKYRIESGSNEGLYTFENISEDCSSILNMYHTEDKAYIDENPCSFSNIDGVKTNTSETLTDIERSFVDHIAGNEELFSVYQPRSNDGYIVMDFASCWEGDGYDDLQPNCNYTLSIEDNSYHVGFKNNYIYIFFPGRVKKYKLERGSSIWDYTFENISENCTSTFDSSHSHKIHDDKPCNFL